MKIPIRHNNGTRNLNIFFSVSLGIHLLSFFVLTLLFPDFKIDRLPTLNIEVSLLPLITEAKIPSINVNRKETLTSYGSRITSREENRLQRYENREEPTYKEELEPESPLPVQTEIKVTTPMSDPPAFPSQNEEGKIIIASHGTFLPTLSFSGEQIKGVKYSPLSDGEILLTQPKYAENPRPLYPQEARKKGYEGEVLLKVEVLKNGRVGRVDVKKSSGYEILDRSALTAVKEWKFIPANQGNGSIPCWVNIPIKFQLQ